MQCIQISEVDGKQAVCFDTGLDPRSFARTKMGQCFTEAGYIVNPDGQKKQWKAVSVNEISGFMRVSGPGFTGERLDLLLENADTDSASSSVALQAALQAVVFWIRAKLLLGETKSTLNPGAAFVCCQDGHAPEYPKGSVFFAPENLSKRCLLAEGTEINRYSCPDLYGMDEAAFCAGVMLYRILAKTHPYPDDEVIFQDMREGIFLPPRLMIPGLDEKICSFIESALLLPVANRKTYESGTDILGGLLEMLTDKEKGTVAVSSLFHQLPAEEEDQILRERKNYSIKLNITVKSRRFISRNRPTLIGTAIAMLFVVFVITSMTKARFNRPSTEGMDSDVVVMAYYDAFGMLNHEFMEACLFGADKSDVNVAINYYAISRVRQAHEYSPRPSVIPARIWRENGGELPAPDVFGVTDLTVKHISGNENEGVVRYRADYLLWFPNELTPSSRSDDLTLTRRRGEWRITEIKRTIN
jgi:hypothetical protein